MGGSGIFSSFKTAVFWPYAPGRGGGTITLDGGGGTIDSCVLSPIVVLRARAATGRGGGRGRFGGAGTVSFRSSERPLTTLESSSF